ncbi:MAG TPA: VCBS repeat-containing protein [Chitinophagaceae bacterium]|nr:VCBS repeat-containing protein [Chitinophagaceae bacterium]
MKLHVKLCCSLLLSMTGIYSAGAQKLFSLIPADTSGVLFNNEIIDSKELNVVSYEYFYNGSGVSAGDINNDGLCDLYFTSNVGDCRLYLNQGHLKFKDITPTAGIDGHGGYKTGTVMVDINNDGWLDIYVCKSVAADPKLRRNVLYINNHNNTFTERAAEYGVADEGFSMAAYFNDLDNDGDLDLLVLNHPYNLNFAKTIHLTYNKKGEIESVRDRPTPFESDQYYENVNGKFINRTVQAGLATRSFGLSAILEDFNGDGKIDIYQANDYLEPDYLFINKGGGKFVNDFEKYFKHGSYSSMGSDYADINNDGFSDLITVDMLPEGNYRQKQLRRGNNYDEFEKVVKYGYGYQYVKNVLQLNNGNGSFSDISYYTNTAFSDWSWGVMMNDFDNDGLKDIYIANGYMRDITDMDYVRFKMDSVKKELIKTGNQEDVLKLLAVIPSVKVLKNFYRNYGNFDFRKETKESGLDQPAWSFGSAYADLDNDGDLEIIVCNVNDYAFIYKNNTIENGGGNSISVKLKGPAKNINGLGAKIWVNTPDGKNYYFIANTMRGYLSSNDAKVVIGIGNNISATVRVTWPDGKSQIEEAKAGVLQQIEYNKGRPLIIDEPKNTPFFRDITADTKISYQHKENAYIDFKLEPMLPHRFSQLGPCTSVADLNGDGREDLVIGGAKDFPAVIYLQNQDGTFLSKPQPVFENDKKYEDGSVTAVDFDKDGDKDLIITSGGNDHAKNMQMYPVRFYSNDGKGSFTTYREKGNSVYASSNAVAVTDFNKDGKLDIFIGGSTSPGNYGLIPRSYLVNIIDSSLVSIIPGGLESPGMIKSAVWADMNNDGWEDLVLAGEWMPITVYYNWNGNIDARPFIITQTHGWWNKIVCTDIDKDGDLDIIGGNLGLNTRYTGTQEKPVSMVVSDFDANGSTDCVISTYIRNTSYPIAIRDYILDQMPYLKKKYLRYAQYSGATVTDIFTAEQLAKAKYFIADNMSSAVFLNKGEGKFEIKKLPPEAQFFPVNGIQYADVNNDSFTDLLVAGNDYSTEVETGRNDAGIGLMMLGNGKGEFTTVPVTRSGFYVPGDVKSLEAISINGKRCYIVGKNMDKIQVLKPL